MQQAASTIVVPINQNLEPLHLLLRDIEDDVRNGRTHASQGARIPFGDLATVHFARFAVLEASQPNHWPQLVFATVHDGPRAQHWNELVTVAGEGLLRVFSTCDQALKRSAPVDALRTYLEEHARPSAASWGGHPGCSVAQIRAEARLHGELRTHLGSASGRLSRDPFEEAVAFVKSRPDLHWALTPPPATRTPRARKALLWAALGLAAVLALCTSPLWLPWLLWLERRDALDALADSDDPVEERKGEIEHKRRLLEDEDRQIQNQLTTVSVVKPGRLRPVLLRAMLWAVDALGRVRWDDGDLAGIRTIHFARWFVVKEARSRRLVFFSNYDRSWESYLGEFVDEAAEGLTGIWSNTVGFPVAKLLVRAGARSELKFKRWVRKQQVTTQVWYSAYPALTVVDVQNHAKIRRGLQGLRGLEERRAWLRML